MIRGIRANKRNEEPYIAQCLDEIRVEVRKNDLDIKANGISKLFYVCFNIRLLREVMLTHG